MGLLHCDYETIFEKLPEYCKPKSYAYHPKRVWVLRVLAMLEGFRASASRPFSGKGL